MGRPLADELIELEDTYAWAVRHSNSDFTDELFSCVNRPLVAVGSGGSYTSAVYLADLFRRHSRHLAVALTPLELEAWGQQLRRATVVLLSAGGTNNDAIGSLRVASEYDAERIITICTRRDAPLAAHARELSNAVAFEFSLPHPKDGFLATNSLLATVVLLTRAFQNTIKLPSKLHRLVGARTWSTFCRAQTQQSQPLWTRDSTIILHGPSTKAAAVDLESKLNEAALAHVTVADYRHFAHGRHVWLAKRGDDTSIIALSSDDDQHIADKTLSLIPDKVLQHRIDVTNTPVPCLTALAYAFPITLAAGVARGVDPGRPGVPPFGRRIYKINAFTKARIRRQYTRLPQLATTAITRKTGYSPQQLADNNKLDFWHEAYRTNLEQLSSAYLRGLVFDYDGTLCTAAERHEGPREEIRTRIQTLLESGIRIGVATGRGRSAKAAIRDFIPEQYWQSIVMGYYNCGQIGPLSDDECPNGTPVVSCALKPILMTLNKSKHFQLLATIEGRQTQITIRPRTISDADECWDIASTLLYHSSVTPQFRLVRSSHSFDIITPDVSKLNILTHFETVDPNSEILTIGDMGCWPGNDHDLLTHPLSLSVDQTSPLSTTCWNLAPPSQRGVSATLFYLSALTPIRAHRVRLKLPHQRERLT